MYLLHLHVANEWLSTSAAFLRVNEVHNLFKSRSISNQTVNWRRWRESV